MGLFIYLAGCLVPACPIGLERNAAGVCVPSDALVGFDPPLTAERFQDRYEDARCEAMAACVCDELDLWDCRDLELDCAPLDWSWAAGCAFDVVYGEACLDHGWGCDTDEDDVVVAIAPFACDVVYDCEPATR